MITPEEIIEQAKREMGRPCRLIHMQTVVVRFRGREYEVANVVYDATLDGERGTHPQLRFAVYVDGDSRVSSIVDSWVERF